MLTRRVIPCLDIRDGRVVKGVSFQNLRDAGDPVERAKRYMDTGADELCFLDVTASIESRGLLFELVERLSRHLFIPFTVGGGVRSVEDGRRLLRAGADKVAVSTAAVLDAALLTQLAEAFGEQCIVLSIDTVATPTGWRVTTYGGREVTDWECVAWAREGVRRGAGEILLNVIDADGAQAGFAIEITRAVAEAVSVPVIASGGAGRAEDFIEVFRETPVTGALAASIFHNDAWTPDSLKRVLRQHDIEVRL